VRDICSVDYGSHLQVDRKGLKSSVGAGKFHGNLVGRGISTRCPKALHINVYKFA
jgi:hypothetical protein